MQAIPANFLSQQTNSPPPQNITPHLLNQLVEKIHISRGKYIFDDSPTLDSDIPVTNAEFHKDSNKPSSKPSLQDSPAVKLYELLSQSSSISTLTSDDLSLLMTMIQKNMLVPVPEVPQQYIYSDRIAKLLLDNWDEVNYLHKILLVLIRNANSSLLSSYFTPDFLRSLIGILNSPDLNEQISIEFIVSTLFEKYPHSIEIIFNESLSRIENHLHGGKTYFCVSSCLKFILTYFKQPICNIDSPDIFEYKIFPLFSSYFLQEFYHNLNSICSMYYGMFQTLSASSLKYLLSHWPIAHTSKQITYIRHIAVIAPYLSETALGDCIGSLIKRLSKCLRSPNYKIVLNTLQLIGNASFVYMFSSFSKKIISALYKPLVALKTNWSPEVQTKLESVFEILDDLNPKFYKMYKKAFTNNTLPPEEAKEDKVAIWKTIIFEVKDSLDQKHIQKLVTELHHLQQADSENEQRDHADQVLEQNNNA